MVLSAGRHESTRAVCRQPAETAKGGSAAGRNTCCHDGLKEFQRFLVFFFSFALLSVPLTDAFAPGFTFHHFPKKVAPKKKKIKRKGKEEKVGQVGLKKTGKKLGR